MSSGAEPPQGAETAAGPPRRHSARYLAAGAVSTIVVVVVLALAGFFSGFGGSPGRGVTNPPRHAVTFTEQGLPPSAPWSVVLNGSTESATNRTITFLEADGTYPFSVNPVAGFTASPPRASVTVHGAAVSEAIDFAARGTSGTSGYPVLFTETGLPAATAWSVTLNGQENSSSATSIGFTEGNGTFSYTVGTIAGHLAVPSSGTATVSGRAVTLTITFSASYGVTFTETGLPIGMSWVVALGGTVQSGTGSAIAFAEANGTYGYSVGQVAGYSASPANGQVPVNGAAVSIAITFAPVPSGPRGTYPIWFNQTGLPTSAEVWSVSVELGPGSPAGVAPLFGGGAEGSSFSVEVPNGTYSWFVTPANSSFDPVPGHGTVSVAGGPVGVRVAFVAPVPTATTFTATVTESGLPAGVQWTANVSGTARTATSGAPITFTETNGSYAYNVTTLAPDYAAVDGSVWDEAAGGSFWVEGTNVSVTVPFVFVYPVTLTPSGLAGGAVWSAVFDGRTGGASGGSSIAFYAPNGSFPFTATAVGYSASPASGTISVAGHAVTRAVGFTPVANHTVAFQEHGLPAGFSWDVSVAANGLPGFTSNVSTAGEMNYTLAAGSYSWLAESPGANHLASPATGGFTVNGSDLVVTVSFASTPLETHLVTFEEAEFNFAGSFGAPNGTSWSVTFNGTTRTTTGMYLVFTVPNGTYSYTVAPPPGLVAYPAGGRLTVGQPGALPVYLGTTYVNVAFGPAGPTTPPATSPTPVPAVALSRRA